MKQIAQMNEEIQNKLEYIRVIPSMLSESRDGLG